MMTARLRKLTLTAHVTTSVGWLGAVVAFLAIGIAALTRRDDGFVRGAYLSMDLIGQLVIVPLSLAALCTGLLQSLGTPWGLFRHYWVLTKFGLTVVATGVLLLHQFTAVAAAAKRAAATVPGEMPDVGGLGVQLVADAAIAVVVLLFTTLLSIYKPWGLTKHGRRALAVEPASTAGGTGATGAADALPAGFRLFLTIVGLFVAAFVVIHLLGGGLARHGR